MKSITEDKVILVLTIALIIISAITFNVHPGEAAYEVKFGDGAQDTGDEFNLPCDESFVLTSFQAPIAGEEGCDEDVEPVKRVEPDTEAPEDCPTPLFLARYIDAPDADTSDCPATSSVISL